MLAASYSVLMTLCLQALSNSLSSRPKRGQTSRTSTASEAESDMTHNTGSARNSMPVDDVFQNASLLNESLSISLIEATLRSMNRAATSEGALSSGVPHSSASTTAATHPSYQLPTSFDALPSSTLADLNFSVSFALHCLRTSIAHACYGVTVCL